MTELVVLAAGMGSRFGGMKQLEPVGPSGETVMDYAVYDAVRAGIERVVFVIRREFEEAFRATVGSRYSGRLPVAYAFQDVAALPPGRTVPEGRTKPWGTGQAVLAAGDVVRSPFVVINADDFYGRRAYASLAERLAVEAAPGSYAMVAYPLVNTLSENGTVSRGVCEVVDGRLRSVVEHTGLSASGEGVLDASGARFTGDELVSMNFWGLRSDVFDRLEAAFGDFLDAHGHETGSELYLPAVIDDLVARGLATVDVLTSPDPWFGMTYAADRDAVAARLADLVAAGEYPSPLGWRA
ncbi:MAG TPA: NTP transferase domain-containing protein [Propionibacteriaceae bacterium]|nr:NTP transferase domain-containing protein [Propionibacteriaceae bacterium]